MINVENRLYIEPRCVLSHKFFGFSPTGKQAVTRLHISFVSVIA